MDNTQMAVLRNIPTEWSEDTIKGALGSFGNVVAVTYPPSNTRPNVKARPTKVAFVRFATDAEAKKAIEHASVDWTAEGSVGGTFKVVAFVEQVKKVRQPRAAAKKTAPTKKAAPKAKKPLVAADAPAIVAKNIPRELNKQQIGEAFGAFGTVNKVVAIKRGPKITAFIVFDDAKTVESALQNSTISLEVNGAPHDVELVQFQARPAKVVAPKKAAAPKKNAKRAQRPQRVPEPANTVVVRAVPVALTEDEVKAAVSAIGGVNAVRFVGVREKSQFKVAYALMADAKAMDAALAKAEVVAKEAKLPIVAYSAERPLNPRVVITRIPLSYTKEQIEALAKEFGEAEVTIFEPRKVEGEEPKPRVAQAAQFRFATQEGVKAALAKKTIAIDAEQNMVIRPYRFRFNNRRAPNAPKAVAQ